MAFNPSFVPIRKVGYHLRDAVYKAYPNLKLKEKLVLSWSTDQEGIKKIDGEKYTLYEKQRWFKKRKIFTLESIYPGRVSLSLHDKSIRDVALKALRGTSLERLLR